MLMALTIRSTRLTHHMTFGTADKSDPRGRLSDSTVARLAIGRSTCCSSSDPAPERPGRKDDMAIRLGDDAPNFTAETTEGALDFYDWKGDSWAVLFSHPKDFTPVCTTELGRVAALKPEFDKRGVKVIGLSVDGVSDHEGWSQDIEDVTGSKLNYP